VLAVLLSFVVVGRVRSTRAAAHRIDIAASAPVRSAEVELGVEPMVLEPPPAPLASPSPSAKPSAKYVPPRRKPARDTFYGVTSAGF
jgi:hypothetical protein